MLSIVKKQFTGKTPTQKDKQIVPPTEPENFE